MKTLKNPLVGIETCRSVLGCSEDDVLKLIESGKLKHCYNLAATDSTRALFRVLSLSLIDHAFGISSQPNAAVDAVRYVLPGSNPEIPCSVVARAFNSSSTHVHHLVKDGCLVIARPRRYAKDSPGLARASVVDFLQSRRCA